MLSLARFSRDLRFGRSLSILASRSISSFSKYTHAIIREISPTLPEEALRLNNEAIVNMQVAVEQHDRLVNCMEKMLGLKIIKLPHENLADSVFVEDTCVIVGNKALITNPGAISRRNETKLVHRKILEMNYFKSITNMSLDSTVAHLDGGDVLFTGSEFYVGINNGRSNVEGCNMLSKVFNEYPVTPIDLTKYLANTLHLKSVSSMLGYNHILVGGEIGEELKNIIYKISGNKYLITSVPDTAAANVLLINNRLITRSSKEFPVSIYSLKKTYSNLIEMDAGELAKVDGTHSLH
jgi:dimethylargininase